MADSLPPCLLRRLVDNAQSGRECRRAISFELGSVYDPLTEQQEQIDREARERDEIPPLFGRWLDEVRENYLDKELNFGGLAGLPRRRPIRAADGKLVDWQEIEEEKICFDPVDVLLTLARTKPGEKRVISTGWETPCEVTLLDLEVLMGLAGWTFRDFEEVREEFQQEERDALREQWAAEDEREEARLEGLDPQDLALREQSEDEILLSRARDLALIEEAKVRQLRQQRELSPEELPFDREEAVQRAFQDLKRRRQEIEEEEGISVSELGRRDLTPPALSEDDHEFTNSDSDSDSDSQADELRIFRSWKAVNDPYSLLGNKEWQLTELIRQVDTEGSEPLLDKWRSWFPVSDEDSLLSFGREESLSFFIRLVKKIVQAIADDDILLRSELPRPHPTHLGKVSRHESDLMNIFLPFWPTEHLGLMLLLLQSSQANLRAENLWQLELNDSIPILHHLYHVHQALSEENPTFDNSELGLVDNWNVIFTKLKEPSKFLKKWLLSWTGPRDPHRDLDETIQVARSALKSPRANILNPFILWDVAVDYQPSPFEPGTEGEKEWTDLLDQIRGGLDWTKLEKRKWAHHMSQMIDIFGVEQAVASLATALAPSQSFNLLLDYLYDSLSELLGLLGQVETLSSEKAKRVIQLEPLISLFSTRKSDPEFWDSMSDLPAFYNAQLGRLKIPSPSHEKTDRLIRWLDLIRHWEYLVVDQSETLQQLRNKAQQRARRRATVRRKFPAETRRRLSKVSSRSRARSRSDSFEEEGAIRGSARRR